LSVINVDIASFEIKKKGQQTLQVQSLGAAVGIGLYDSNAGIGGIYAFMFPDSAQASTDLSELPLLFANTGLQRFFSAAAEGGANVQRAKIAVCGGADFLDMMGSFTLGQKNCAAIKNWLEQIDIKPDLMELGGMENRTLDLNLQTGTFRISCAGDGCIEL
jgi:chemotaxis protein CheD